ncbi:hypothetical protein JOC76_001591 [Neobacillus cucumis]|nr:hypothetical protein [Neobacillus cucumis]
MQGLMGSLAYLGSLIFTYKKDSIIYSIYLLPNTIKDLFHKKSFMPFNEQRVYYSTYPILPRSFLLLFL